MEKTTPKNIYSHVHWQCCSSTITVHSHSSMSYWTTNRWYELWAAYVFVCVSMRESACMCLCVCICMQQPTMAAGSINIHSKAEHVQHLLWGRWTQYETVTRVWICRRVFNAVWAHTPFDSPPIQATAQRAHKVVHCVE